MKRRVDDNVAALKRTLKRGAGGSPEALGVAQALELLRWVRFSCADIAAADDHRVAGRLLYGFECARRSCMW
jgi:hypothetical protein